MRAKRGSVGGWSNSSTRSNTRFLYSVEETGLTGSGFALSLTLRDCPPSHEHWHRMRRAFFERLRRMGLIRAHWLTEWQSRGVPHLHAAVWLPEPEDNRYLLPPDPYRRTARSLRAKPVQVGNWMLRMQIIEAWLAVADSYGAGPQGQHVESIRDAVGWFKYLSKHASRGVLHYQRSPESIPQGWKKTGRMWGYLGAWPLREAMELRLDTDGFHAFRRVVRSYRLADARDALRTARTPSEAKQARRRLTQARGMLRCHDHALSSVRGVSEWIEVEAQLRIVAGLAANGYAVEHV